MLFIGILIGVVVSWLLIKLPAMLFFRNAIVEPVDAWLIEEKKRDGREGVSVYLSLQKKEYADKFAQLNGIPEVTQ